MTKLPPLWWLPIGDAPSVSPELLQQWLDEKMPLQIVDTRTEAEYRQGTIDGARHAHMTDIPGVLQHLELDRNVTVILLCANGHRSLPGTRWLRAHGFEAYNLEGGVLAWKQTGYPLKIQAV